MAASRRVQRSRKTRRGRRARRNTRKRSKRMRGGTQPNLADIGYSVVKLHDTEGTRGNGTRIKITPLGPIECRIRIPNTYTGTHYMVAIVGKMEYQATGMLSSFRGTQTRYIINSHDDKGNTIIGYEERQGTREDNFTPFANDTDIDNKGDEIVFKIVNLYSSSTAEDSIDFETTLTPTSVQRFRSDDNCKAMFKQIKERMTVEVNWTDHGGAYMTTAGSVGDPRRESWEKYHL